MAGITKKSFGSPDESRTPPKTTVEVVRLGETTVARFTFQPGGRWSQDIAPVVGTDPCQVRHVGAVLQGTLHTVHADGSEGEASPGALFASGLIAAGGIVGLLAIGGKLLEAQGWIPADSIQFGRHLPFAENALAGLAVRVALGFSLYHYARKPLEG